MPKDTTSPTRTLPSLDQSIQEAAPALADARSARTNQPTPPEDEPAVQAIFLQDVSSTERVRHARTRWSRTLWGVLASLGIASAGFVFYTALPPWSAQPGQSGENTSSEWTPAPEPNRTGENIQKTPNPETSASPADTNTNPVKQHRDLDSNKVEISKTADSPAKHSKKKPVSSTAKRTKASKKTDLRRKGKPHKILRDQKGKGPAMGLIFLDVRDSWAVVYDGEKRLGETPLQIQYPAGKHSFRLVNPETKASRTLEIQIQKGQRTQLITSLAP
jgi:hypothetical protein